MLAIGNALTLALCLGHSPARPPAAPGHTTAAVAVEFLVDASAAMGLDADSRLPMVLDVLRETVARESKPGLRAAVRLYGSEKDAADRDCSDTVLAIPFAPPDPEAWAKLLAPVRSRGAATLAAGLAAAAADLAGEKASARLLVVVAGGGEGCGADSCAAASRLVEGGLNPPRVVVVSANLAIVDDLACVGSLERAAGPAPLAEALADAIADAGPATGLAVTYYDGGAGKAASRRYSAVPVARARKSLVTSARPGDVHALPQGIYRIQLEDEPGAATTVKVTEGQVTHLALGRGSLKVRALSYYGGPLAGSVEVLTAAPDPAAAAAGFATQPAAGTLKTQRHRVPHSTLPMVAPQPATAPAAQPATQPAAAPATRPATEAATTPSAGISARTGDRIDLPAGEYEVVVKVGAATLGSGPVVVTAGETREMTVRFGAVKVVGPDHAVAVLDRAGHVAVTAAPRQTVPLSPGSYRLGSRDGQPLGDWFEVVAGDIAIVELR